MPEHNTAGGYLPALDGTTPRNTLTIVLTREHFSGSEDGYQRLGRDYCDECLPVTWKHLTELLAYGPATP
jgi:hypothetical protein